MIKRNILLLGIEGLLGYLFLFTTVSIPCFIKSVFHIPCPGCGLTRAFRAILHLHLKEAFQYHVFSIPFFLLLCFLNFLLLWDIVKKTDTFDRVINRLFRYYWIWILVIGISEITNLLRHM